MGVYIGYIEKKGYEPTIFFNFKPIAEVRGSQIIALSPADQEELLPESEKRNINFAFSWNDPDDRQQMDTMFTEKSLDKCLFHMSIFLYKPQYILICRTFPICKSMYLHMVSWHFGAELVRCTGSQYFEVGSSRQIGNIFLMI